MKTEKQTSSDAIPDDKQLPAQEKRTVNNDHHIPATNDRTNPKLYLEAQQFALAILADPVLKELYTKLAGKRCTPYSLALSEYLALRDEGQWIY